jgi:hypothetical protein
MPKSDELALIYPTPEKETQTVGYPNSDLFRWFAATMHEPETALLIVGHGFADAHVRRQIAQALSSNQTHG